MKHNNPAIQDVTGSEATVLLPEEGQVFTATKTRTTLKLMSSATAGRFSLAEYTLPAGFPGPPIHVHRAFEHAWYMLKGKVQVQINDRTLETSPGTFVFIPKGMAHTFSNPGPEEAKMIAIDTPGGFEAYYEELATAFPGDAPPDPQVIAEIQRRYDTFPPDPIQRSAGYSSSAIVIPPGEGKSVRLFGVGVVFKLVSADTGGAFALVEHPIEPGALAAPPHRHLHEDEYSYVLEGEVIVQVGKQVIRATPGTMVCKPRGVFHAFWNERTTPARILEIISPAGFEKYFEEVATLISARIPPDDNHRLALAQKYHLEFDRSRVPELVQKYHLKIPGTVSR